MSLLEAVKTHLEVEGFQVGIGAKPEGTADGRPYAVLYLTSGMFDGDVELVDTDQDAVVHVKTFGRLWGQVGEVDGTGLAGRLDRRLRNGQLTVDGFGVQLVKREQTAGPTRDDDTYPEPSIFYGDAWYRIWIAPDLS